jgi:hypothetical protein
MKKNRLMFWSGLFLTFGGTIILPVIAGVVIAVLGKSPDELLNLIAANPIYLTLFIAALALPPIIGSILLFGSILIPLFSNMQSKNKVITEGVSAEAKILALNDTGTRVNHNPLIKFKLEVHSPTQAPFQAETSQTVSMIHLPSYQPGKMVNVKYIPGSNEVAIVGPKIG